MFFALWPHSNSVHSLLPWEPQDLQLYLVLSVPASRCLLMLRSSSAFSLLVNKSSVVPDIRLLSSNCPFRVPEKVRFPSVLRARFFCFSKLQTKVRESKLKTNRTKQCINTDSEMFREQNDAWVKCYVWFLRREHFNLTCNQPVTSLTMIVYCLWPLILLDWMCKLIDYRKGKHQTCKQIEHNT